MKKNFLFGVLALAGLLSSCSHDDTADALQNSESDRVTLTATLPADFATIGTRALPTPPSLHKLRCILEVWTQDETPVLKFRDEQAGLSGNNVQFNFTIDEGTYDCLFWADYVLLKGNDGTKVTVPNEYKHYTDKYYKTTDAANGLKAVSLIAEEYAGGFNTTARDAFFGHYKLEKKVASVKNPDIPALTRPLAKLTIKEKNEENYAYCNGMTATYSVPAGFNVLTGTVNTENPITVTCEKFIYDSRTQEMFTDYILTDASSTLGQIAMTFTSLYTTFQNIDIPAGIPLKRNHKTNATGTLLREEPKPTNDVQLTLEISDVWETTDEAKDVDDLVWDGTTTKQPAGYTTTPGTVDITTAAELAWLAKTCTAGTIFDGYIFNLTTDINLNNHEWTPIGNDMSPFEGTFDGQNHTVSNLKCTSSDRGGLFSYLHSATVKNVTVSGSVSCANQNSYLGGIAGWMTNSTISGCTNQCSVTATGSYGSIGGIVGYIVGANQNYSSTLSGNTNTGTVSATGTYTPVGGIVGDATAVAENATLTLTDNIYSGGTPADVCMGTCYITEGSITIDGKPATSGKPNPVPATE